MALQVRQGGGTYTVTAGQAAGSQLQIVSLAGTRGFSRNARVYGFGSTSAVPTRTVTQMQTRTQTQTYTQTQTQTQPTRTQIYTSTSTQTRASAPAAGAWTQPQTGQSNAEAAVNPVRQWFRSLRNRVARVGRRLKLSKKKGKEKEEKKVTKKATDTSATSAQMGAGVRQAQPAAAARSGTPVETKSATTATEKTTTAGSGSGGQTKKRPRIATIFKMAAAAAPAGDPKEPGGSQTLTAVNDEKKGNGEKAGSKRTHGASETKKGRKIMTIRDLYFVSPAPDPGPPAGSSTTSAVDEEKRDKETGGKDSQNGGTTKKRQKIITIWDLKAAAPVSDLGDSGGSSAATTARVGSGGTNRGQLTKNSGQVNGGKKPRINTIWTTAAATPAPDPGDPGGSSTAAAAEDCGNGQKTNAGMTDGQSEAKANQEDATVGGQQTEPPMEDTTKKKKKQQWQACTT